VPEILIEHNVWFEPNRVIFLAVSKVMFVILAIVCFGLGFVVGVQMNALTSEDENEGPGPGEAIVASAYEPDIDPDDFVEGIDNPWFTLVPGTTHFYEGVGEDGEFNFTVHVTHETRDVMGVTCVVVRDTEYEGGKLAEDTYDWYAQDKDGNVWYFGEDSKEYDEGKFEGTAGSWESGKDGAYPGIIMLANPMVGMTYRQEYYEGEAEDMGTVIAMGEKLTVEYGSYEDLLVIQDSSPLEPEVMEYKYYAKGVGVIREEAIRGEDEFAELVDIQTE
jgi:hypothetical protein